jgi:DNA-binding CsgD family transcriptional regulator
MQDRRNRITPREQEILQLAGQGLTNAEIGERLGLAVPTVKGVLARLMRRFDCHNRLQLVLKLGDGERRDGSL